MQMVKQQGQNECGLCTVAMLTDRTREQLLTLFPHYENMADCDWLNYIRSLGFALQDPRNDEGFDKTRVCGGNVFAGHLKLPLGQRYYCSVSVPAMPLYVAHAVAIDERGMVFDPSSNAPMTGTHSLEQYVMCNYEKFKAVRIACCYPLVPPTQSTVWPAL
jgi:hypothetical protein